ncbi:MAG TPA: DUF4340 domain-containing protein [Flavobacteriales bacterium]|nr:DUF4340 domain-containing protein [Flavobacteriales bacterium]
MKNKLVIFGIVLLGGTAAYLYFGEEKGTLKKDLMDFAVEDTASIDKIFLANKAGSAITLERKASGGWTVNKKYKARWDLINVLLSTIKMVEVQSPISRNARDNIISRLSAGAVKVEIYQGGSDPVKVYYVGGSTQNDFGTYMLLEGSTEPYIMHVSYFHGYLTTRYNTKIIEWRDKTVMNYEFKDIASIKIEYPQKKGMSFEIKNTGNWKYELWDLTNDKIVPEYDTTNLTVYLTSFKNIQFEGFLNNYTMDERDSILLTPPLQIMECKDLSGNSTKVTTYLKKADDEMYDGEGKRILYDPDRLFAEVNDNGELVTVQYFVFGPLFLELENFNIRSE